MKKFLIYLILVPAIASVMAGIFFSFAYKQTNRDDLTNFQYILSSKENHDIVVFGSSRALRFINPCILDSVTGLDSYNLGANGIGILETRMMLLKFIQLHSKPKLILLNVDHNGFYSRGFLYNSIDYYPYLSDTVIANALCPYNKNYGNFFVRKTNQLLEMFASSDDTRYHFLFNKPQIEIPDTSKYERCKGYGCPLTHWSPAAENSLKDKRNAAIDDQGFNLLADFIQICKKNEVNIILVHAPILYLKKEQIFNYDEILNRIKNIADETQTPYWEYDTMKICNSKYYFRNFSHVNLLGADIYSKQLAKDVKVYLSQEDSIKAVE